MAKKLFSIIFICFFTFLSVFAPISASAYEFTGLELTAKAGMLISLDTEEILFEKNIDEKVYPASITKIMTASPPRVSPWRYFAQRPFGDRP
ncbi:MAG: hypothetical protein IKJ50_06935 [Clostridia bacterium]|nr:hypothetical protein [Clostridia bacterium]